MNIWILCVVTSFSITNGFDAPRDTCKITSKIWKVPIDVKHAIRRTYETKLSMVSAGREFQETDVVAGRWPKKERRLIAYVNCDGELYLLYEHGGYGRGQSIIHLRKVGGSVRFLQAYYFEKYSGNPLDVIRLLNEGKLMESLGGF